MSLLLLIIIAHLLADFLFQSGEVALEKERRNLLAYLKHYLVHLACLVLLTHFFYSPGLLIIWFLLPLLHVAVDYLKCLVISRRNSWQELFAFLIDQSLHLLLVFMAWQLVTSNTHPAVLYAYDVFVTSRGQDLLELIFTSAELKEILFYVVIYGYVVLAGSALIRKVLDLEAFKLPEQFADTDTRQAGRYIGIMERLIILTLAVIQAYTAIGLVLAVKSIARFKELEEREFAEYYVMGTLLSMFLAVLGGLAINHGF